jgi:translation initiation factor RLI1
MDAAEKKILNNYFGLLERMNPSMKLNLIERLTASIKSRGSSKSKIHSSFGAWDSEQSADELIDELRISRHTNRQIEEL